MSRKSHPKERWRNRIVGHGEEPPDVLVSNPKNWRRHPDAQRRALAGSLGEVGWVQTVIVNRRTGRLVDGHARVDLARKRGEGSVPVVYVDLSEEEEALVLATLDPIGALASSDREALDALLKEVATGDTELNDLLVGIAREAGLPAGGTAPGLVDVDDVPPEPDEHAIYVEAGQTWRLGEHRLLAGDAASRDDIRALVGGDTVGLLWTDPPYAVDYDADARPGSSGGQRFGPLANDDLPAAEYEDWLRSVFKAVDLRPGTAAYICHADTMGERVRRAFRESGHHLAACIIWSKTAAVMSRGDYHWAHEPVLYGWREGAPHRWRGDRRQSTVWTIATDHVAGGDGRRYVHPTQKPVELIERALFNSSQPGDVVLDPFLGSGSTLIAAERLGRRCRGMDIEPRYVQVAIERWERFTGRKAEVARG